MDATELIERLGLVEHPEGGWYRRTWVAEAERDTRPIGSAIYYLLKAGEMSRRHRIDATEMWHFYAGAPLELAIETAPERGSNVEIVVLGSDISGGQRPQHVVPPGSWQWARSLGAFTLVGCTVSPAFSFEGLEID